MGVSPLSPAEAPSSEQKPRSLVAAFGRRTVLVPLLALLVFEVFVLSVVGGYLAIWLGIPYIAFGFVSLLVYLTAGFVVRREGGSGALAGGGIALVESALWAAGVQIGPQPGLPSDAGTASMVLGVSFTVFVGLMSGALGAALASRRPT